ncbi:MAG: tetratricopeptide repeat protein [Chthoniobacterales bacterium]
MDRRQGRWAEATRSFDRAIALDPRNVKVLGVAADTYRALHRYSESNRLFQRALAISPSDHNLRLTLDGVLGRGNLISPREGFAGLAARAFHGPVAARTSFTAARASVEKIVRDQPDYAPALSLLDRIDAALGQKEEALRESRRACELVPLSKDAALG